MSGLTLAPTGDASGLPASRARHPPRSNARRGGLWTVPELWKTHRTRFPQLLGRRNERAAHNGPQGSLLFL